MMEKMTDKPIVELRVVQNAKKVDGELVYTNYTLQCRWQGSHVWVRVPVIMKMENEND